MNIEWIREKISQGRYEFRKHALERSTARGINPLEVKEAILEGEIIEDYPNDPRGHSCLIFGKSSKGKKLHVVCGIAHNLVWIVTVYEPSEDDWIDYKRRRRKSEVF
jgi:hypothetical protein